MKNATCPVDNKATLKYVELNMQSQTPDMPDGVKEDKRDLFFPKQTADTK